MLFSGQSGGGVPDLRGMEKILPIVKYAYFGNWERCWELRNVLNFFENILSIHYTLLLPPLHLHLPYHLHHLLLYHHYHYRETEWHKVNQINCTGLDSFFLGHFLKKTCLGFHDLIIRNHVANFFAPGPFLQCGS